MERLRVRTRRPEARQRFVEGLFVHMLLGDEREDERVLELALADHAPVERRAQRAARPRRTSRQ